MANIYISISYKKLKISTFLRLTGQLVSNFELNMCVARVSFGKTRMLMTKMETGNGDMMNSPSFVWRINFAKMSE